MHIGGLLAPYMSTHPGQVRMCCVTSTNAACDALGKMCWSPCGGAWPAGLGFRVVPQVATCASVAGNRDGTEPAFY